MAGEKLPSKPEAYGGPLAFLLLPLTSCTCLECCAVPVSFWFLSFSAASDFSTARLQLPLQQKSTMTKWLPIAHKWPPHIVCNTATFILGMCGFPRILLLLVTGSIREAILLG